LRISLLKQPIHFCFRHPQTPGTFTRTNSLILDIER